MKYLLLVKVIIRFKMVSIVSGTTGALVMSTTW